MCVCVKRKERRNVEGRKKERKKEKGEEKGRTVHAVTDQGGLTGAMVPP
jgi:hypothetical protein